MGGNTPRAVGTISFLESPLRETVRAGYEILNSAGALLIWALWAECTTTSQLESLFASDIRDAGSCLVFLCEAPRLGPKPVI